jgi:SnoaL-like polyketide cyclase.
MSEANVELTRRAVEAWNSGGVEGVLRFCPDDVVWHPFPQWPDGAEPRAGHDGVRELMQAWLDNFDDFKLVLDEARDLGHQVLLLGAMDGQSKGSGSLIHQPFGWVCADFREGLIGEMRFFLTRQEALNAAGLLE